MIEGCPGGAFRSTTTLQLLGDGTVLRERSSQGDIGGNHTLVWAALADASYFDTCSSATIGEFLACIDGALGECQLGEPSCP